MSGMLATCAAAAVRALGGASVRWAGQPLCRSRCVFFANHGSHLDFVVLWAALPADLRARTRPVAAREYWTATPLRRFAAGRVFRAALVDRAAPGVGRLRAEVDDLVGTLDAGDSLILFPEGTRGGGPGIAPFKGGLYFLARQRPEVDLVPVHLHNLSRIMPKGEFLPVPQLSCVTFGSPIRLHEGETKTDFLARARAAVAALAPS